MIERRNFRSQTGLTWYWSLAVLFTLPSSLTAVN